jgi:c-di-GMP-binding flagellar brake protein YcgR
MEHGQIHLGLRNGQYLTPWGECFVIEMSGGGCRIVTPFRLPVLTLMVNLKITIGDEEFSLEGEIVWKDIDEDSQRYKYGLQWVNLSDKERDDLVKALVRQDIERRKRI